MAPQPPPTPPARTHKLAASGKEEQAAAPVKEVPKLPDADYLRAIASIREIMITRHNMTLRSWVEAPAIYSDMFDKPQIQELFALGTETAVNCLEQILDLLMCYEEVEKFTTPTALAYKKSIMGSIQGIWSDAFQGKASVTVSHEQVQEVKRNLNPTLKKLQEEVRMEAELKSLEYTTKRAHHSMDDDERSCASTPGVSAMQSKRPSCDNNNSVKSASSGEAPQAPARPERPSRKTAPTPAGHRTPRQHSRGKSTDRKGERGKSTERKGNMTDRSHRAAPAASERKGNQTARDHRSGTHDHASRPGNMTDRSSRPQRALSPGCMPFTPRRDRSPKRKESPKRDRSPTYSCAPLSARGHRGDRGDVTARSRPDHVVFMDEEEARHRTHADLHMNGEKQKQQISGVAIESRFMPGHGDEDFDEDGAVTVRTNIYKRGDETARTHGGNLTARTASGNLTARTTASRSHHLDIEEFEAISPKNNVFRNADKLNAAIANPDAAKKCAKKVVSPCSTPKGRIGCMIRMPFRFNLGHSGKHLTQLPVSTSTV